MEKEKNNFTRGYVREKNSNPISFDTEGNLIDLITKELGTMMLSEVTVRGISPKTRAKNYSSAYDRYALPDLINWGLEGTVGKASNYRGVQYPYRNFFYDPVTVAESKFQFPLSDTNRTGNKFVGGGPKDNNTNEDDTYFGLTTDDWKDVGLDMLPVVGTIRDALTFWEEPSLINGIGLGVSAATDIATLFGIGAAAKGAKALYRAYKAKEALSNTRRIAAKQAANKYRLTRMDRVSDTATNKKVKSSIQSMLAKKQNAELAKLKAELANTLFWDYTKAEMKNNVKQIVSPLKLDTVVNFGQSWWNTNM